MLKEGILSIYFDSRAHNANDFANIKSNTVLSCWICQRFVIL